MELVDSLLCEFSVGVSMFNLSLIFWNVGMEGPRPRRNARLGKPLFQEARKVSQKKRTSPCAGGLD